jgi:hypothetical protein
MKITERQAANNAVWQAAWDHVHKTKRRSVDKTSGRCVYTGIGCGFSPCVIDPEKAGPISAHSLLTHYPERLHEWARQADPALGLAVQVCHDLPSRRVIDFLDESYLDMEVFEKDMLKVASKFGIDVGD